MVLSSKGRYAFVSVAVFALRLGKVKHDEKKYHLEVNRGSALKVEIALMRSSKLKIKSIVGGLATRVLERDGTKVT